MTKPYFFKNDYQKHLSKICIFNTYLHTNNCPQYVLHYIKAIRQVGYEVMLVSHSDIPQAGLEKLAELCCTIVLKENEGYDFFAWKFGMSLITEPASLEHLLLANDSVFGPFMDMAPIFSKMNTEFDFWGLTVSQEQKYHVQSYFLHANKKVLNSDRWKSFWNELKVYKDKLEIVRNYEINLTQTLIQDKTIKVGAWVPHEELISRYPATNFTNYPSTFFWHDIANPTVKFWKELLTTFNFPFIKKNLILGKEHYHYTHEGEVFEYAVWPVNWKNIIEKKYGYQNIQMIRDYADELFNVGIENKVAFTTAKYKILLVAESINSAAQIDYLARIIRFYNQRNVETELIINKAPLLKARFDARLHDITKVNILGRLSVDDNEKLKHRLSQEHVGTIVIADVASCKLAQHFSYTNAPHVLISTKLSNTGEMATEEYNFDFHSPYLVSPLFTNDTTQTLTCLDPINIPVTNKPNRDISIKSGSGILSFIGLNDFKSNEDEIIGVIRTLKEKGLYNMVRLFFNEEEYSQLKKIFIAGNSLLSIFENELKIEVIQYTRLADYLDLDEKEVILSYYNECYLPDDYLDCYLTNKVMLLQTSNELHKALGGSMNGLPITEKIQLLLQDHEQFEKALTQQRTRIEHYLHAIKNIPYEQLLFKEVIDFNELTKKEPLITVIFHFHFYSFDQATFVYYKERLRAFYKSNVNFLFSITEDSYEIKKHVDNLRMAFPGCVIKIVPNKGRDIGAKFLLFDYLIKSKLPSEYVVVLHDKKSLHLPYSEAKTWIDSLLRIIDPLNYKKVLNAFQNDKTIGILGSKERVVDCIISRDKDNAPVFEWNNDILHKMLIQYNINISDYNFVGGTMFWIKTELLKKLNEKYNFLEQFMKLEEGNVMDNSGSTITHSWERLISWLSINLGYRTGQI